MSSELSLARTFYRLSLVTRKYFLIFTITKVGIKWLAFLLRILKFRVWNLDPKTGYLYHFSRFSSEPPIKYRDSVLN
jgi:hypothetical protein